MFYITSINILFWNLVCGATPRKAVPSSLSENLPKVDMKLVMCDNTCSSQPELVIHGR